MKDIKLEKYKEYKLPEPGKYIVKLQDERRVLTPSKEGVLQLEFTDTEGRLFFIVLSTRIEYEIEIVHKETDTFKRVQVVSLKLLGKANVENWEKALRLEGFIRYYTPPGFREPIHQFDFSPCIYEEDFLAFEKAYKEDSLLEVLSHHTSKDFQKPYVVSAIQSYFSREYSNLDK